MNNIQHDELDVFCNLDGGDLLQKRPSYGSLIMVQCAQALPKGDSIEVKTGGKDATH